jgi:secreted trypsin-like serine protease
MYRFLILSVLLAQVFCSTLPESLLDATQSAEFKEWSGRIVGGQTAAIGQFPYQASMRSATNAHFCGGFLINARTVGCAAHCTINRTPANTFTVVGAHNRVTGGITIPTEAIRNHPNYNSAVLTFDISIVHTTVPIVQSATVGFIPILSDFVATHQGATASGWGQTTHPGVAATELQFLNVNVITNEECRSRLLVTQAPRIQDTTLCVSSPDGQGLCKFFKINLQHFIVLIVKNLN